MSVAVYPRLGELLRQRDLSVAELERRIEQRFGLAVDTKTLYRLAHRAAVQRADLQVAGAAAAVLGVGLTDLFDVETIPVNAPADEVPQDLTPAESRHLADLLDRQGSGSLSDAGRAELEALVGEYGRRLHERRLRELAEQHGIPIEQARAESQAQLDGALGWWSAFGADAQRRRAVAPRTRGRRLAAS